ncbi:MAG: replication initiation protein [Pseudomonadota bacterium]
MIKALEKTSDKYVVTQSNTLIEADYSQSNLPAKSLKIARLIVAKISPDDNNFRLIKIQNNAIRRYLGYRSNVPYNRFNEDLEDVCKRLNKEPLRISTGESKLLNAFLISSWEVDLVNDTTEFEISGKLKPHLLQLKRNYTSYLLENIPRLNSSYSIRIYELLAMYRKIGKRKLSVDDLKAKIGCNYEMYGHLKNKAILKAQKDLKKYTNIRFEFEEIKNGRKVAFLVFYIYPNNPEKKDKQQALNFLDEAIIVGDEIGFSDEVVKRIYETGISLKNITNYINLGFDIIVSEADRKAAVERCKTLEIYFCEKLTLLEQTKTTSNPAGFFIKALKEDWKIIGIKKKTQQKKNTGERKKALVQANKLLKEKRSLEKENEAAVKTIMTNWIAQNKVKYLDIYDNIEDYGKVVRLKKPHLDPMENYEQSPFLTATINIEVMKKYPHLFREVKAKQQRIKDIEDLVKEMDKQWFLGLVF